MTVFGLNEYANPRRGPTFQLDFPFALELWKIVAPGTPAGLGALGSNGEKRPYCSWRSPCQSKRSPTVRLKLLVTLMSSFAQMAPYFILGMYLNGTLKVELSTWPRMKEANSLPVWPPSRGAPVESYPAVSLSA